MANSFLPGRDLHTLEAMQPEEARRHHEQESAEHQAELDREELAELERAQAGLPAPRPRQRSLLDRLLRRG